MKTAKVVVPSISYPRDLVFATACAAQRINGQYVKRPFIPFSRYYPVYVPVAKRVEPSDTMLYNAALMKSILASDQSNILPEDYEYAELVRNYYCSKIAYVFGGEAGDFLKNAVDAASTEEIATGEKLFGLTASLPSCYANNVKRDLERNNLRELTDNSIALDAEIGQLVILNVKIVDAIFKEKWQSNAVNALVNNVSGNRMVFFFSKHSWTKGNTYNVSGTIKNKGNQTTQLNRVTLLDPSGKEKDM
jgi:hypothetical protein